MLQINTRTRDQLQFFDLCRLISNNSLVRFIDAFYDSLDALDMGFI